MPMNPDTTMTPFPIPLTRPCAAVTIRTRPQLELLLENIATLQRERADLFAAQERELAAVRHRYRAQLTEIEEMLRLETSWAETWAQTHPEALAADRQLTGPHATLGFRAAPPRIDRASRRWTWTRIATTLAGLAWGPRYLRVPAPEVDKDAIAADLGKLSITELRAAGIVTHGETFFIGPHATAWQEAA